MPSSLTVVRTGVFTPAALTTSKVEKAGAIRSLKVRLMTRGEAAVEPAAGVERTRWAWAAATDGRARAAATATAGRRRNRVIGRSRKGFRSPRLLRAVPFRPSPSGYKFGC
ncbi:hypothetical protein D3C86_1463930 [compost metagenome]